MKKSFVAYLLVCLSVVLSSCDTYYVAASNTPVDIYTSYEGYEVAYNVPVGSVLLMKGKVKNGLTRVRYHTNPTWYWVDNANLSLVPNANPKYYDLSYVSLESTIASSNSGRALGTSGSSTSTGYSATIQTGSRGGKYYINKNGKKTYVPRSTTSGSTKRVGGKGSRGGKH